MREASSPRRVAIVLALLVYALAFQGARGLWDPDEGRYTAAALQMIRQDNYRDLFLHHEIPHFTKPPTTYWLLAASFRAFGQNELAARLPGALAFWGTMLLLLSLGGNLVRRAPWAPAAIYAACALPAIASNIVTTDTVLAFFETLAAWAFLRSRWAATPRYARAYVVVLWAALGLAFLTKGPPGLLPLIPIALSTWIRQGWARALALVSGTGLLVFAVVGLGWYLVAVQAHPGLLMYFLGKELFERVATDVHDRNAQWYGAFRVYVPALAIGLLPWVRPAWWALRNAVAGLRRHGALRLSRLAEIEGARLFPALWLLAPLTIFFLAQSRLPLYLVPLFAPLSILLAQAAFPDTLAEPHRRRREIAWTAIAAAVAILGLRFAAGQVDTPRDARALAAEIRRQVPPVYDEIVRPGRPTRYGLSLYLQLEVEPILLGEREHSGGVFDGSPIHGLEYEMAEAELERPLFVVRATRAREFREHAERLGFAARERGKAAGEIFYTLSPKE